MRVERVQPLQLYTPRARVHIIPTNGDGKCRLLANYFPFYQCGHGNDGSQISAQITVVKKRGPCELELDCIPFYFAMCNI